MRKWYVPLILSLTMGALAGCMNSSNRSSVKHIVKETNNRPGDTEPIIQQEFGYNIVRGSSNIKDMVIIYDPNKNEMNLTGSIEYRAVHSGKKEVRLDLLGPIDREGVAQLNNNRNNPAGIEIAAKMTCVNEFESCDYAFIDLYVLDSDIVYHHQFTLSTGEDSFENLKNLPTGSGDVGEDHDHEPEIDRKTDGEYIGTRGKDIEDLFGVPPKKSSGRTRRDFGTDAKDEPKLRNPEKKPKPFSNTGRDPRQNLPHDSEQNDKAADQKPKSEVNQDLRFKDSKLFPSGRQTEGGPARSDGRLIKPTNMLELQNQFEPSGFKLAKLEREHYYGTKEMAHMLLLVGEFAKQNNMHTVAVGDLSASRGGKIPRHKSHRNGMDADIGYFFKDLKVQSDIDMSVLDGGRPKASWKKDLQWELFKKLVATEHIDRIFVHSKVKKAICTVAIGSGDIKSSSKSGLAFETLRRLNIEEGHDAHFHLRVKCAANNTKCWQMAAPAKTTGCF